MEEIHEFFRVLMVINLSAFMPLMLVLIFGKVASDFINKF